MAAPQKMDREVAKQPALQGITVLHGLAIASPPVADPSSVFKSVASFKFGPTGKGVHREVPVEGSGPFGLKSATGIAGSTPLTDPNGKLLATLTFVSHNREMGQMSAQLVLPDGRMLAQIERPARKTTFAWSQDPSTVLLNGAQYATVDSGKSGGLQRADGSGGVNFNAPCCQPATKWCVFAFCCFFPTFGIASCYALCKIDNAATIINLSSSDGANNYAPLAINQMLDKEKTFVSVDMPSYDARTKLDLVLLLACHVAAIHTDAPHGNGASAGGGVG